MKKLPLILTAAIFSLTIGGYFLYHKLSTKSSRDFWSLVPESSVIVYESGECQECIQSVKQSSVWKIIQKLATYSKQSDSLKSIFRFLGSSPHALVSVHITKKDDFDFVFYTKTDQKNFNVIIDEWKKNKNNKFSERELNSIKIQEISNNKHVFSWAVLDNIWVGSFTPFLIEDVIRVYESENEHSFKERMMDVTQLPKLKNDAGNLFIHLSNFSEWLKIFTEGENAAPAFVQSFGRSSVLGIKANDGNFALTGLSSDSSNQSRYTLSVFGNQSPVPFNLKQFISNRSVLVTSYGINDGEGFRKDLMNFSGRRILNDTLARFSKSIDLKVEKLFKDINGEIGVCYVESKGQEISRILLIDTRDPKIWIETLNAASEKLSIDTVFYEKFSNYEIRELPLYRFPEKILWPLVSGFDQTYYTSSGNTIFIAHDLEELKRFLDDIDKEETWGKSVSQNKFLESTLLEANISVYVNTSRIWNILSGSVNVRWKPFISENQALLRSLGMGAVQFSHLNESFYTNVSWKYSAAAVEEKPPHGTNQKLVTNFTHDIGRMVVVRNHVDKQDEVLVQDSAYNVHLISSEGKVLWKIELDGMIRGNVEQIDYFNNGKLQYFFATANKLYVIDRLGNYVKPFPVSVSAKDIEYVSVVDYDHSRKYRFLVASKLGKLWMYDKEGNNLEGWRPQNVEEGLATAPRHHRIRGKDYIIAIRKDGKVHIFNRRGEILKKFPLNLDARPQGDYFLETGNDLATTYFIVISRDGYRIKFNLEGKIQSRETLVKNSIDARFALIREKNGKSYLMLRQESKQTTLLDESGKELITNDYVAMDLVDVEYVDFGAGKIFITLTDEHQGLSFVYDKQGSILTNPPAESYFTTTRPGDNEKLVLYTAYGKALTIQSLQ